MTLATHTQLLKNRLKSKFIKTFAKNKTKVYICRQEKEKYTTMKKITAAALVVKGKPAKKAAKATNPVMASLMKDNQPKKGGAGKPASKKY
jgi:hypothetical protein